MNPQQYTGKGDSFLDFKGSAVDFGSEINLDKIFSFTITNAGAADQVVILNPSYYPTSPGRVIRTGAIPYTSGATDLTAVGSPTSIEEFLAFVKANPTCIVKMQIKSNNAAQLSRALIMLKKTPFKAADSDRINIGSFTNEYANNDKLASITRETQFDDQVEVQLEIPKLTGGVPTETTITFYCGASLNSANALTIKKNAAMLVPEVQTTKASLASKPR